MVTFIEEGHIYLNSKGKQIPSVSQLVNFACGNAYANVDRRILQKKADYGTRVHAILQDVAEHPNKMLNADEFNMNELIAIGEYKRLMNKYSFFVKNVERQVDYKELYAGRYDLLTIDNKLVDFKTYASIDEDKIERFSWQLGFYYLALRVEEKIGYIMWLPKGLPGKVIEVKAKSWRECLDCLEQYLHPQQELF